MPRCHAELTDELREDLRLALHATFIASFAQGLNLIARASEDENWNVKLASCIRIWREGCIIRAEGLADVVSSMVRVSFFRPTDYFCRWSLLSRTERRMIKLKMYSRFPR
jgi:6-phosphogluconate dehydrogenase